MKMPYFVEQLRPPDHEILLRKYQTCAHKIMLNIPSFKSTYIANDKI